MTKYHDPFNNSTSNLGSSTEGIDRAGVDDLFTSSYLRTHTSCLICGNGAKYKLIPKHKHLNTAEIQDKGYACVHCIQSKFISPTDYKLVDLEGGR